jgi:signal transduction histidine kinase
LVWLRDILHPSGTEADEGFRQELLSLSQRGLTIVAAVEVALALLGLCGLMPRIPSMILLTLGLATFAVLRLNAAYSRFRGVGLLSCALGAALVSRTIMTCTLQDFALGAVVVLVLTGAAGLPLLPLQSLALGLAAVAGGFDCNHQLFLTMLTVVAVAISTTLYAQRRTNYSSYLSVLQASQDYRAIQSRLLVAENSATMVRLSAALAHELSQPVATVISGVDTLLAVCARHATAGPDQHARLLTLEQDLGRSLQTSLDRLKRMVNRIQRLTTLDEAGSRPTNLNELLNEAAALVRTGARESVLFEFRLQPLPEMNCRAPQLLTVFTVILTNALQAIDGEGSIQISSRPAGGRVEIHIQDSGRGIEPERLNSIFDPGFQVAEGRVSTGNWSLFTSRQFIKDHGGEMRIQSRPGEGTTVSLILPCSS